jgi:hypothetical protein
MYLNPRQKSNVPIGMDEKLRQEAENKYRAELLFASHRLEDISSELGERKSGTDFLAYFRNSDGTESGPYRCENKFEQYHFGRVTLETVSVDRERVPGWLYTSQAGWLFSWFAKAGDLLVCPMDEVRDLVLANPTRHQSTTALNKTYLSWSVLEDINYLLLNVKNSRVLDLRYELGDTPEKPSQVKGTARSKFCTSEQLVEHMRSLPASSLPRPIGTPGLEAMMKSLAPLNRKATDHADRIQRLPFMR